MRFHVVSLPHTLQEFIDAAVVAPYLDREYISFYAKERYGLDSVALVYDKYFKRLLTLWGKGWYELTQ